MTRKKIKKKGDELDPQGWMTSFSDLLTLMLTFFVLLFSMSSMDNLQFHYYMGSLRGALGGLGKGAHTTISKPKLIATPIIPSEELTLIEDAIIRILMTKSEKQDGQLLKKLKSIEVYSTNKFAQILFPTKILFQKDSADISPSMALQLEQMAAILKKFSHPLRVNGYSHQEESLTETGEKTDLSIKRAAAVLEFLISKGGIAPILCGLAGYGRLRKEGRRSKVEDYVEIFIIKATNYSM